MTHQPRIIEIEISVSKIVFDPEVQPRPVIPEWVEDVISSIQEGYPIGPIRVGKRNDHWVCIEGHHRTTAYRKLGLKKIKALLETSDEEAWPGLAIKYNDRKGHAITKEQREKRIREMYLKGTTPAKIAETMGRSRTYVYNVLQPLIQRKQEEKAKRDEKVRQLHEQGLTLEEIAKKTDVSKQTVSYILKRGSISSEPERLVFSHGSNVSTCGHIGQNYKNVGNCKEARNETSEPNCQDPLTDDPEQESSVISATSNQPLPGSTLNTPEVATDPDHQGQGCDNHQPAPSHPSSKQPDTIDPHPQPGARSKMESQDEEPDPESFPVMARRPEILKWFKLVHRYPTKIHYFAGPASKHALLAARVLELIATYRLDLIDIQEDIEQPLEWIRTVATAAIATVLSPRSGEVAAKTIFAFRLHPDTVDALVQDYTMLPRFNPIGQGMDKWVDENLREPEIQTVLEFARVERAHLPYLLTGHTPPPRKIRRPSKAKLKDIIQRLKSTADNVKDLARTIHHLDLTEKELDEIVAWGNKVQTALNGFYDKIRKQSKSGFLGEKDVLGIFTEYVQ